MAAMAQQVDFGCVPHSVVEGLQEIGNWKVRAAAVEALHTTVLDIRDVLPLLPTLSKFLQFLMSLVDDPNFKVSISAMRILQDLLGKLGAQVQPYLGTVMETLINKLGDRNEAVRQAVAAVMAALMQTLGPQPVLNSLGGAFVHPEWRVREQGLNVVLLALLSHGKDKFDYPSVVRAFSQGACDESERVRTVSLEGLAALHERLGPVLQGLLTAVGASEAAKRQVADRVRAGLPTPYLNVDGQLEHQAHARPASAGRPKAPRASAAAAGQPALAPAQPAAAVAPEAAVPNKPQAAALTIAQAGIAAAAAAAAAGPQVLRPPPAEMQASAPQPFGALEVAQQQPAGAAPFALAMAQDDAAQLLQGVVEPQPLPEFGSPTASAAGLTPDWAACSPPAGVFSPPQPMDSPGGMQHLMVDTRYPSWSSSMASSPGGGSFLPEPGCCSADAGAAESVDDGSNAGVERSGESLLQWVRPGRGGPLSQSSRQGGVARSGGSLSPGASRPAVLLQPGSEPPLETMSSRSSSFSSAPGLSPLGSSRPSLSVTPPSPGAPYYPDMYAGVAASSPSALASPSSGRSPFAHSYGAPVQAADGVFMPSPIQHRRPTRGSSLSSAASTGRGAASGAAEVWEALPSAGSGASSGGGADVEVEGRSDSLLMWRLPARPGASPKKVQPPEPPAAQQPARWQEPEGARMAAAPEPPRSSSASVGSSILQKLDGFKKKLFGPDMPAAPAAGQQDSVGAPWSIPAIRTDPESRSTSRLDSVQPDDSASQQGSSPNKGGARLSILKRRQQEAAERRRVWSAPVSSAPQSQRTTMNDPEEEEQGQQPTNDAATGAEDTGSLSPAVSPVRPGLQALKVRARTARMVASGSEAQPPASPSSYGMDVLTDVFGPDRAALTTAWSPMQHGPSPGRMSLLTRAGSPGWTPSSPGSAVGTPGAHRRLGTSFLQKLGGSPGTADPGSPAAFSPTATDLSPLNDPEGTMRKLLQALEQANMSQKKELDWQSQYEALCNARRIIHNHAFALLPHIHQFVLAAAPVMDSLRSIPARLAITVFQELIEVLGPALDGELEHLVPVLIKKAGVVSVAGRDNFLAVEADKALGTLVNTGSETRVVTALLNCLSTTKAADVKGKISIHLDAAVQRHGHRLVANASITSRVLRVAVGFLDEGSLECRTSGKRILWEVRRLMDISLGPDEFKKALGRLEVKTNKVWETLESQQGRPPPPVRPQPAVRSPSGSMLAPVSLQPPSPGAGRPSSLLSAASLGYSALGEAGMSLDQHSTVTYQPTPSAAAPAPPAAAKPGSATLRPTVSFKTLTLGTAEAGAAGGSSSSSSAAPPGRTPSAGPPLRRNLRPRSGRQAGASSAVPLPEVDPELALQVDSLQASLSGKDWRERMQALGMLRDLAPRLPALPGDTLLRLMDALGSQLTAANVKVQLEALGIMAAVFGAVGGAGVGPGLNSLVPALSRAMDSGSMNARQLAANALDALLSSTDAALFVQPYMQALSGSSNARSKSVLLDRLRGFAPGLYAARPQLVVRHVLPPLFSALGDKKLDVREALQGVLTALAGCMGLELLDACIAAAPAHKLMISELVAQQQQQQQLV